VTNEVDVGRARTYETITLRRGASNGAALQIELNRPQAMNAWDYQLGEDLLAAVRGAAEDESVRAVTIVGSGRGFCSGADLKAGFPKTPEGHANLEKGLIEQGHPVILAIRGMSKPVVASVNGAAAGIGCALALACDLVLAAESAYFLLAFVNIGLVPDGGSSALVSSRVGFARAAQMAVLGERIPAPKALEWGLINGVVPDGALAAETDKLAQRLATGPTQSYARTKRQLNAWMFPGLEAQLELEARLQQEAAVTADFDEGVKAFVSKRTARFSGV
jgi:2-(1,2-epoxy-1,2-dihydrophenyl)acetyl-CoA isomerase